MCIEKIIKNRLIPFLLALSFSAPVYSVEFVVVVAGDKSKNHAAGFKFTRNAIGNRSGDNFSSQPIIHYQQNIHMLATTNDRLTFQVFGDGRVLVHYPIYMKLAGDYEMQLDEAELIDLLHSLSDNGVMDFDTKKHKAERKAEMQSLKAKGQYFAISDTLETIVEIRLDEYQKNNSSNNIRNFYKKFHWDNLEQDAKRFKQTKELARSNQSVNNLKKLMKDVRLTKRTQP